MDKLAHHNQNQKNEWMRIPSKRKIGSAVAGIFMLTGSALGLAGCGDAPKNVSAYNPNTGNNPQVEINQQPSDPGFVIEATPPAVSDNTETAPTEAGDMVTSSDLFKSLSPEQQEEVTRIHNMSQEDFDKLRPEVQLRYTDIVYRTYEPATASALKKELIKAGHDNWFLEPPATMTKESTTQEILDRNAMEYTVAQHIAATGQHSVAAKMFTMIRTPDTYNAELKDPSNELSWVDSYMPRTAMDEMPITEDATSRSTFIKSLDVKSNTVWEEYNFIPYTGINGEKLESGQWVLINIERH